MSEKSYPMTDDLFKVRVFEPDSNSLTEALAITDERADQIQDFCKKAYIDSDTIAEAYEKAMLNVKHINEACYAITIIAANHTLSRTSNPLEKLLKSLKDMNDSLGNED